MSIIKLKTINEFIKEGKEKGILIVDVREVNEYEEAHIEGVVNVPLSEFEKIEKVAIDKNAPLYLHCRSGKRSGDAAERAIKLGYKDVTNIGGILDWNGKTI